MGSMCGFHQRVGDAGDDKWLCFLPGFRKALVRTREPGTAEQRAAFRFWLDPFGAVSFPRRVRRGSIEFRREEGAVRGLLLGGCPLL